MNVGITGHQKLKDLSLWKWVTAEINELLSQNSSSLAGFTSLAIGADQIFAEAVLKHGGNLHVIIPFEGYELKFSKGTHREEYFHLINRASSVETLDRKESDEASYFAAGKKIADLSTLLFAVWDGNPAAGLGGTGDVVQYAVQMNKKVIHLNPVTQTVMER